MSVNINHQLEQVNNLKITPVGTGATVGTAGIVTYYGDGSQLSGVSGGGGLASVSDDTNPQLGGTLNATGYNIRFGDSTNNQDDTLRFGASADLQIYHRGNQNYISVEGGSGDLYLTNHIDDKDVIIRSDNGSNSVTEYFRADGSTGESILYHYGTQKLATKSNGIAVSGIVTAISGIVTYYGDGSQLSGVSGSGISSISEDATPQLGGDLATNGNDILFADTDQAKFGTGNDLIITHSGLHSLISHSGTGNLYITNTSDDQDVVIRTDNGSGSYTSYFLADGSTGEAILSHYGSEKLATKSTGISVTGNVSATSFTGDGSGLTNITATGSGVGIQSNTSVVGTAQTINFGTNLAATISGGVATITATGGGGGSSTTRSVNRYVANNGDTLFPPSGTVSYDVGYIDVYLNGSKLDSTEYTATNGTTITLTTGASQSDIVELVAYTSVNLTNVEVVNDTTPQLGGNLDLNGNTISDGTDGGTLINREEAIAYAIAFG